MGEHIMNTSHMGSEQKRRIWDLIIHEVFNLIIFGCAMNYIHTVFVEVARSLIFENKWTEL